MKVLNLLLLLVLMVPKICFSQHQPQAEAGIDIGGGFHSKAWSPSILYYEQINFHRANWLKAGIGIRLWGLYAGQADLHAQKVGGVSDVLQYENLSANGLSFVVGAGVGFWKIDIGANTDLAGLVLGSTRTALYPKASGLPSGQGAAYYNKRVATAPTSLNALPLAFKTQTGQSEIFLRAKVARNVGVKVGFLYSRITYATKKVEEKKVFLDNGQRHFSKDYGMPYGSVTINLSR